MRVRYLKLLVFAVVVVLYQGCGSKKDSQLEVSFINSKNYIIDASATSCSAYFDYYWAVKACGGTGTSTTCTTPPTLSTGSLGGPYVSFGKMTLNWSGGDTGTLVIIYIKFTFKGPMVPGGSYTYTLADKELWTTWRRLNSNFPYNPRLPDANDTAYNLANPSSARDVTKSDCEVMIPGVQVANRKVGGTIPVSVFVYGYSEDSDGKQTPVTATASATADWYALDQ